MACNNEYEIIVIDNEIDARLCAKLMAEEFVLQNPLTIFSQPTAEQLFDGWLWPLMTDVLDQKLSFFVRHCPTNEIVAATIANDLFLVCEKHPYDASAPASSAPLADLFQEMCDSFIHGDFGQELKPNMVLCISAGATRAEYSGKGVAGQLRAHVCNHTRDTRGFQYAFIQTAHPATRHIYVSKMGGKEMTTVDPATWLWKKKGDGLSCPLKGYKGEPTINTLVKLK
jgi:hypothetical protein